MFKAYKIVYSDVNRNERLISLVYTSNYEKNVENHLVNETTFGYIHTSSIKLELLMLSTISLLFSCISTDLLLISCNYQFYMCTLYIKVKLQK